MYSIKGMFLFSLLILVFAVGSCCKIPPYDPAFWNDSNGVQYYNNCYNYGNNKETGTYAQPGRAAGAMYTSLTCTAVYNAAVADGLTPLPASGICPNGCSSSYPEDKVALVVDPGRDYHWYRQDSDGMWSHKPGQTRATNLDNSGNTISNPETADRGGYTDFCGYLCSCSSSTQGKGSEKIE